MSPLAKPKEPVAQGYTPLLYGSQGDERNQQPSPVLAEVEKKPTVGNRSPLLETVSEMVNDEALDSNVADIPVPINSKNKPRDMTDHENLIHPPKYHSQDIQVADNADTQKRVIETADIRLGTLSSPMTWLIFLIPYFCFGLAIYLDSKKFTTQRRYLGEGHDFCESMACKWIWTSVPVDNSFLSLSVIFNPTNQVEPNALYEMIMDMSNVYTVSCGVHLSGIVNKNWIPLVDVPAMDNIQLVKCSESECDDVTLMAVAFDSPGMLGPYHAYKMEVSFQMANDRVGLDVDAFLRHASFFIELDSQIYSKARLITTKVLMGANLLMFMMWLRYSFCRARPAAEKAFFQIPERLYLTGMMIGMILVLNPVHLYLSIRPSSFSTNAWLLTSDITLSVGVQLMWLSWVCLVDGLRYMGREGNIERGSRAFVSMKPNHSPGSDYFFEFIFLKGIYASLGLVLAFILDISRYTELLSKYIVFSPVHDVRSVYVFLSLMVELHTAGWIIIYFNAAISVACKLRSYPFMSTRRQQLTLRVILGQTGLISLLLVARMIVRGIEMICYMASHQSLNILGFSWHSVLYISNWSTSASHTPLGRLLFMNVVILALVYVYLPPVHSIDRKVDRMYVKLECRLPSSFKPLFCLERAWFLSEVAWQSYFDPHRVDFDDIVAPGKQDLSCVGLSLVDYIEHEGFQARVILCRGDDRLVLAFRGTATLANIKTDFDFKQTPLRWGEHKSTVDFKVHDEVEGLCQSSLLCLRSLLNRIPIARQTLPRVHAGFLAHYNAVRSQALQALRRELSRNFLPLQVTGHSLGGALAQLAALDIVTNLQDDLHGSDVCLYTFGSPNVGNAVFANLLNSKVPNFWRVENDGDPVCIIPQCFYSAAGTKVTVDSDRTGSFIVQPTLVEKIFGAKRAANPSVHLLSEYRDSLEACLDDEAHNTFVYKRWAKSSSSIGNASPPKWLKQKKKGTV